MADLLACIDHLKNKSQNLPDDIPWQLENPACAVCDLYARHMNNDNSVLAFYWLPACWG